MLSMAIRPEQVKMFPDVPQKLGFRFGVRYRDVDVRSMLVGVDLASWFDVTVASGDRCVPAVDDAIDGPASARLVVSHDDGFSVWGPNGSFQGRFGLDDASFRRRIGYLRLSTGPAVPDHGDPSGDGMVLKLRPEHAAVLRS